MDKIYRHFYITYGLKEAIEKNRNIYGMTKTAFVEKAILLFINGSQYITPQFLITKKTDANYVKRDTVEQAWVRLDLMDTLSDLAKEKNCTYSLLIFQAIYNYCYQLESNE